MRSLYNEKVARAAALTFDYWEATVPVAEYSTEVKITGDYKPGKLYIRELEPLLAVIDLISEQIEVFMVDAYCYLSESGFPGLGAHLHAANGDGPSIIGVAKNRYKDTNHAVEIIRGRSSRPLFVTAIGLTQENAASKVMSMSGEYRIPTFLKKVDRLARTERSKD